MKSKKIYISNKKKMMYKRQKDFLIVFVAYSVGVIAIIIILPINMKLVYVALVLIAFGYVLQWYCNRNLKE